MKDKEKLKVVKNLKLREMNMMRPAIGMVLFGGVVCSSFDSSFPLGIALIIGGTCCTVVASKYRQQAEDLLNEEYEKNCKKKVKLRKDIR